MSILDIIERETKQEYRRHGKQYSGPCPFCHAGENRFCIWPDEGRYWCRVCQAKGDDIQFFREYKGLSFAEACQAVGKNDCVQSSNNNHNDNNGHNNNSGHNNRAETQPVTPPGEGWATNAATFVSDSQAALWSEAGLKALSWLRQARGLTESTIRAAGLGYNDHDHYVDRQSWGLSPETTEQGRPKGLWLPRGIVIPWFVDGDLWAIRIRRPPGTGDPKYYFVPGGQASAIYNADSVSPGQPVGIFEGEFNALTAMQEAKIAAVATGSTHGARRVRWLSRLSTANTILVCYDSDQAGDQAAQYWIDALPNAKRWRPWWDDANDLLTDGVDVAAWMRSGLGEDAPPPIARPDIGDLTAWTIQSVDVDAHSHPEVTRDDTLAPLNRELQTLFLAARKRADAEFDQRLRARQVR